MASTNKKFYQGRVNALTDLSRAQADQYNVAGSNALQNVTNPGLAEYSDYVRRLSFPGASERAMTGLERELNTYGGRVSGMYENAGYTPEEKRSMRYATAAPIAGAYVSARQGLKNNAAVTNNPSAYAARLASLGRMMGRDVSEGLAGLEGTFANARQSGQQFALNASQFLPQAYANVVQGERQFAPAFQFAPTLGADIYKTGVEGTTNLFGQIAGMTNQLGDIATRPGFWSKAAQTAIGNLTNNLTNRLASRGK